MIEAAHSTLPRDAKGPMTAPPRLQGDLQAVVDQVVAWPGVEASTHWHFADQGRIDGVDFYVGGNELGHLHLDGSIHLATSPTLSAELVADGLGSPFRYARGWTQSTVDQLGVVGAAAFFRRNYDRLRPAT